MTTRVDPVRPPYPAHVAERLDAMMPPGVPPILCSVRSHGTFR